MLQIINNVDKIKSMINEGEISASQVKTFVKTAESQFKDLKDFVDNAVKQEIYAGVTDKFELRMTTKYDYSSDEEWQKLNTLLKDREEKLKTATMMSEKNSTYIDEDGVIISPVVKKFTEALYLKK